MLRQVQEFLIAEASLHLQRLENVKEPLQIVKCHAQYLQTVKMLRLLGKIFYPNDKESADAVDHMIVRDLTKMQEEVITGT
jgi:hypothetical protein